MSEIKLSMEEGIQIQTDYLNSWKTKLVPECFADLKAWAVKTNGNVKDGFGICRGSSLSTFVANWKPKKEVFKMNPTEQIINKAMTICKADFMQYPDYDEDIPLTLADALTIIVTHDEEHDSDMNSDEIYKTIAELIG